MTCLQITVAKNKCAHSCPNNHSVVPTNHHPHPRIKDHQRTEDRGHHPSPDTSPPPSTIAVCISNIQACQDNPSRIEGENKAVANLITLGIATVPRRSKKLDIGNSGSCRPVVSVACDICIPVLNKQTLTMTKPSCRVVFLLGSLMFMLSLVRLVCVRR